MTPGFDDLALLADAVAHTPRPLLIGLDVDGVLAPIVAHPDDARLTMGVNELLERLAAVDDVYVAVVSGRSAGDLDRFGFPASVEIIGSHGLEVSDRGIDPLDSDEEARLQSLAALASEVAELAGEGAWVEYKPASVVLHVRGASPELATTAVKELHDSARTVDGATTKAGSAVLELFARSASKGTALIRLGTDLSATTTVFVGDDVTDEDAFAVLGPDDVTIKVGDADTVARHRLRDPGAVAAWLHHLADALDHR